MPAQKKGVREKGVREKGDREKGVREKVVREKGKANINVGTLRGRMVAVRERVIASGQQVRHNLSSKHCAHLFRHQLSTILITTIFHYLNICHIHIHD